MKSQGEALGCGYECPAAPKNYEWPTAPKGPRNVAMGGVPATAGTEPVETEPVLQPAPEGRRSSLVVHVMLRKLFSQRAPDVFPRWHVDHSSNLQFLRAQTAAAPEKLTLQTHFQLALQPLALRKTGSTLRRALKNRTAPS